MTNVIVHCSDSFFGNAAEITKWHLQRGFDTIAYHFVILNGSISATKNYMYFDGYIETGRPLDDDGDLELDEKGAHAFGYNMAVGICLIGYSNTFSDAQLRALRYLITKLRKQFGEIKVLQHSDVDKKKPKCAGLSKAEMDKLNTI